VKRFFSTHYLESFDPTRHTRQVDHRRRLHAKIELLLSLLFGLPMIVPESYSFDSWAFLDISWDVLDKRSSVKREARGLWDPFMLSMRAQHGEYHTMVADLLGSMNFFLSAEPVLDQDMRARTLMSEAIRKRDWRSADRVAASFQTPIVQRIERLDSYFSAQAQFLRSGPPIKRLEECVRTLEGIDGRLANFEKTVSTLREAIRIGRSKKVNFDNRTDFRRKLRPELDPDSYLGLQEFMDTAWNRVVASSTVASTRSFSTGEDLTSPFVQDAEEVARLSFDSNGVPSWSRLTLEIATSEELVRALDENIPWESILALINTTEWVISNERLQKALKRSATRTLDPWGPAEEALSKHVEFLADKLQPFTLQAKDNLVTLDASVKAVAASLGAAISFSTAEALLPETALIYKTVFAAAAAKFTATLAEQFGKKGIEKRSEKKTRSAVSNILRKDVQVIPDLE
jgi:hypothetical protein